MKRILILSHYYYPSIGGIETFSEILANYFIDNNFEVRLLTWSKYSGNEYFPYRIIRNPDLISIITSHIWADFILENNPCTKLSWPGFFLRKPNLIVLQTWLDYSLNANPWKTKLKCKSLSLAGEVVAISNSIREKIWPSAALIHNSYNAKIFKKLHQIKKDRDFVFLGRLVSDKGADLAIQAIMKFNQLHLKAKANLTVIGNGPELPKLKKLVVNLSLDDVVHFVGPLKGTELVKKLNECKYFLVPSIWDEPFGIVALEAMACGCIPIVSKKGGLPEAVGNAGLCFESGNVESLVEQMLNLIDDEQLQKKLQLNGDLHLQQHHPDFIGKKYLELIRCHIET